MSDSQSRVFDAIRVGMSVRDVSDRRVGMVAAVEDSKVRVDVETGSAWLSGDVIFTVERGVVTLLCSRKSLKQYIVTPPLAS
jgi:hypothetical protein